MNPSQNNNFKKFEDESDLDNKNISLNVPPQPGTSQVESSNKKTQPKFLKQMIAKKEDVAIGLMVRNTNASEEVSNSIMNKINTNLEFIGKYFNVEVEDIQQKLLSSVTPMNKDFHQLAERNPDLYGPFWIYTTLIFLVTFAGNLSNYFSVRKFNLIKNIFILG